MNLPTEQIRARCTDAVFDRAVDHREDDRIDSLHRFGETVTAAVLGSQPEPYEVSVDVGDVTTDPATVDATAPAITDATPEATCTCPYDGRGLCKHVVAVLLELSERDGAPDDEREAVRRVLSDATPGAIEEFLLEESERDPDLRRRLRRRFEDRDSRGVHDYKQELAEQYRVPGTFRYEGPSFAAFHDQAERHRERGDPLEAATIYRAMTEVRIENMNLVDDYYGEDLAEELDALAASLREADLGREETREHLRYLFERWTSDDPAVGTFSGPYRDALLAVCTDDADLKYVRTLLERDLPEDFLDAEGVDDLLESAGWTARFEVTRRLGTYADVLAALGDDEVLRGVYDRYYRDVDPFCLRYACLLAAAGETDRAIAVAEDGLETVSKPTDLRQFLIDAYADPDSDPDRDPERRTELVREQFLATGDWEYYELLRSCCSDDEWEETVADLEAELEGSSVHRLVELYLREDRTAAAFETVVAAARGEADDGLLATVRDDGLAILSEYREAVADHDPETYYETYEALLGPFLADTTGRNHYRTVVGYLEEMRTLGFDERLDAFVAHLEEKHSNRPAFLDELSALDS